MIGAKSSNIRCVQVVSNKPAQWDKIINFAKEFDEYYYIFHDKDKDEDGNIKTKHLHCIVYDKNGTSLLAWCNRWAHIVPPNMVNIVLFKASSIKYLTHETAQAKADGKALYRRSDLVTNKQEKYYSLFNDNNATIPEKLQDFELLKNKKISPQEFVQKYRTEIDKLNFYHQMAVFKEIYKYGL